MSNPEEIRRDIERTRSEMSENVNALGDSTSPGNIARGQVDKVKEGAAGLRERVFGAPHDPHNDGMAGGGRDTVEGMRDDAAQMVADTRDAVADAPQKVKSGTRGNPLAAGLIALGVGALVGGLIPSSQRERDAARQLKEAAEPLIEDARQMAMDAKDQLQPLAQDAAEAVGAAAKDAGEHVKQDAAVAKDQVVDQAQDSADTVKGDAGDAAQKTKQDAKQATRNQPGI